MKGMKYEDIIYFPHHVSEKHPRMSLYDRAAQFSAFAALAGHREAIRETGRLTQPKVELDEDSRRMLDEKLRYLKERSGKQCRPVLSITYFEPDGKKSGGKYNTVKGEINKIKEYEKIIVLEGGEEIPVDEIVDIDGEVFWEWE